MEIIEKIQLTFDDLDEERLVSTARTCSDLVTRFEIDLAFCESDQTKLEIIQSKRKEVQEKIKEMAMKAHYAVDLYNQHLNIELKKAFNNQAFNIPLKPDDSSIFKVEIVRLGDLEDEYNEVDHVECALTNAQKVCEESIVWTIFHSELEDLEQAIQEEMEPSSHRSTSRFLKEERMNYSVTCKWNIPWMIIRRWPNIPTSIIFWPTSN